MISVGLRAITSCTTHHAVSMDWSGSVLRSENMEPGFLPSYGMEVGYAARRYAGVRRFLLRMWHQFREIFQGRLQRKKSRSW